jgi:hypothetical protein
MIQFRQIAFILRQTIELSVCEAWNIGAAEAAADEVRLASEG